MAETATTFQFHWSVWDRNPNVSWTCNGRTVSVTMRLPPLSVSHLARHECVAIVGNPDEFGSSNLHLYAYDGSLKRTFLAPALGKDAQFGGVAETRDHVEAIIGYVAGDGWVEKAGRLDFSNGQISDLHRHY